MTLHNAQETSPEQSKPFSGSSAVPVGPLHEPPPQVYGVPAASMALASTLAPISSPPPLAGGSLGGGGGGGGDSPPPPDVTQHWMSFPPGHGQGACYIESALIINHCRMGQIRTDVPGRNSPPSHPFLDLLRQKPEPPPLVHAISTQHCGISSVHEIRH